MSTWICLKHYGPYREGLGFVIATANADDIADLVRLLDAGALKPAPQKQCACGGKCGGKEPESSPFAHPAVQEWLQSCHVLFQRVLDQNEKLAAENKQLTEANDALRAESNLLRANSTPGYNPLNFGLPL